MVVTTGCPCPILALCILTPLSLQHFFTSFGARDRCFLLIFRLWQNALLEKVGMSEWCSGGWG